MVQGENLQVKDEEDRKGKNRKPEDENGPNLDGKPEIGDKNAEECQNSTLETLPCIVGGKRCGLDINTSAQ